MNPHIPATLLDAEAYALFYDEAKQRLARLQDLCDGPVDAVPDKQQLIQVQGEMHSLKGTAHVLGLSEVVRLSHAVESLLQRLIYQELPWGAELAGLLSRSCLELRLLLTPSAESGLYSLITEQAAGQSAPSSDVMPACRHWLVRLQPAPTPEAQQALQDVFSDCPDLGELRRAEGLMGTAGMAWQLGSELSEEEIRQVFVLQTDAQRVELEPLMAPEDAAQVVYAEHESEAQTESIRVPYDRLERLRFQVQVLQAHMATLRQMLGSGDVNSGSSIAVLALDSDIHQLGDMIDSASRTTVHEAFSILPNLVSALGAQLGKSIRFELLGGDIQIEKKLVNHLVDALLHLVRNACDHGIETAEQRQAAGKSAQGRLRLEVSEYNRWLRVLLSDDGGGLDSARILAKAAEMGLDLPNPVDEKAVWQLIFEPGFSTAAQLTHLSGRGVGMDVVRRHIVALGGYVHVESQPGEGTRFLLEFPAK
jgi:two-component system chemotaxis sensor kinase CheA